MKYFITTLTLACFELTAALADPLVLAESICESPPFKGGEQARFSVKIGFVKVGEAEARLRKSAGSSGESLWKLDAVGKSVKPVSLFYKVRDSVQVWMLPGSFQPRRRELHIDETNERSTREVDYNYATGTASYIRTRPFYRKNKDRQGVTTRKDELLPGSFEPFSLFLRLRCIEATVGDVFEVPVHEEGKNYTVRILVDKVETIRTPLGRKEALRATIEVFHGNERVNKRPYRAWVSNDERRVPLKFVADLKFANLKGVLVGYQEGSESPIEGKLHPDLEEYLRIDEQPAMTAP